VTDKPIRVVVVDDSAICRVVLREMLEADGDIRVTGAAEDGEGAVRTVERCQPDLATIDIMMPGPDGLWAVEQIMALRPVPILVVTGQPVGPGSDLVFKAVSRGALDLSDKPALGDDRAAAALRAKVRRLARLPVVRHVRPPGAARSAVPGSVPAGAGSGTADAAAARPPLPVEQSFWLVGAKSAELTRFVGKRVEVAGTIDERLSANPGTAGVTDAGAAAARRAVTAPPEAPADAHPSAPSRSISVLSFRVLNEGCT